MVVIKKKNIIILRYGIIFDIIYLNQKKYIS